MRWLLLAAAVAVAGVAWLLFSNDVTGVTPPRPHSGNPDGVKNGQNPQEKEPDALPDPRKSPEAFLAECEDRGEAVVAELLALLEGGSDEHLTPGGIWRFPDGRLAGFPTLRAVYLEALKRIKPDALAKVLPTTESVEETYFIALALRDLDRGGWTAAALDRAAGKARPRLQAMQADLVKLAAEADPAGTAAYLARTAPRGEDKTVPRAMATSLTHLPPKEADATAETLLADKAVTVPAKVMYMRAYCERTALSALRTLTGLVERKQLSENMRTEAAYLAADAGGFVKDGIDYQQAIAAGDTAKATEIRERFEGRFDEVQRLVYAAFAFDVTTSDDARAKALRRILDRHRKRIP